MSMRVSAGKYNVILARSFVVVVAVVVWFVFYQTYETKTQHYEQLNKNLTQQVERFNKLNNLSVLVEDYSERFNKFMPVKQFENENRLYWLDQLELIRVRHKIPNLRYEISQRKDYKYKDGLIKNKGIKISVSDMKLTMGILHIGDLTSVLDDIQRIESSVKLVTSCEIRLLGSGKKEKLGSSRENIEAVCYIKWFTFKVA